MKQFSDMLFESFGAQFLAPVYTCIEICPRYSRASVYCIDRFPILDPFVYTLRIRLIFRIGGTIYRNERKTDARILARAQNGFATRGATFSKGIA